MFAYLLTGVFRLQVVESEAYTEDAESSRTTTITLRGSRGMITDADAVILARDADIYNVTFYRDASQNSAAQYRELTQSIVETVEIIERNGNELDVDFVIERDPETNEWIFNFGSGVSESVLQTRENQWRSNHYMTNLSAPAIPPQRGASTSSKSATRSPIPGRRPTRAGPPAPTRRRTSRTWC